MMAMVTMIGFMSMVAMIGVMAMIAMVAIKSLSSEGRSLPSPHGRGECLIKATNEVRISYQLAVWEILYKK